MSRLSSNSTRPTARFELTPKQDAVNKLLAGPQRHTCIYGGSRSGKTFLLCRAVLTRAIKGRGSRHAILRARYNAVRASIWLDTLPKVAKLCFPGVTLKDHRADGFVELPQLGSQIWFGGLDEKDRTEKILGQEYATMLFNECSQIPYSSITLARTRLAQNVSGLSLRAYYDLNPPGTGHWTNLLFGQKIDPESRRPLKEPEQFARAHMNPGDNRDNLPEGYIESELESLPDKQRRRFLLGEYVPDIDGALWTIEAIEKGRIELDDELTLEALLARMRRVLVAVDPSGTSGKREKFSNDVGIVVVGLGYDGLCYVIADLTCNLGPTGWAGRAITAFHTYRADAIVAETNFGGAMVKATIHAVDDNVPVIEVTASRGKAVRAEPVSTLYGQTKVCHVGRFAMLEEQMLNFSTSGYLGEKSPDRADALVWGVTALTGKPQDELRIR